VWVGEVLQVHVTPDPDIPTAPAGLQNARREKVGRVEAVGVGIR
jgi:hypothetical protein